MQRQTMDFLPRLFQVFGKTIRCGELILWMTGVSQAVSTEELQKLVNDVLRLHNELGYDRAYVQGNQLIQDTCFDRMIEVVLKNTAE